MRHTPMAPGCKSSHLAPLNPLVDRLEVKDTSYGLCICLRSLFPTTASERFHALTSEAAPAEAAASAEMPADELRRQHTTLKQANKDLQAELEETNRGVVALYAELADQADQLRQAEDRLRLLLDSVHDYAICMLSPQGRSPAGMPAPSVCSPTRPKRSSAATSRASTRQRSAMRDLPAEHLREAQERGRHRRGMPAGPAVAARCSMRT